MRVWRMSLRRTKSATISWAGWNLKPKNETEILFVSWPKKWLNLMKMVLISKNFILTIPNFWRSSDLYCLVTFIKPGHEKMCRMSYANNKGADQPAHPRNLISAFVVRCLDSIISLDSTAEISRLQLASVAAQAGLCLTWSEIPEDTFCRVAAHFENSVIFWIVKAYKLKTDRTRKLNKTVDWLCKLIFGTLCVDQEMTSPHSDP